MKRPLPHLKLGAVLLAALSVLVGCESTDGGGAAGGSVYYGTGMYDPWYHGGVYYPPAVVVPPPPPVRPVAPAQPIYRPPTAMPRPTPRAR